VKSLSVAHPDRGSASASVDVQRYVDGREHGAEDVVGGTLVGPAVTGPAVVGWALVAWALVRGRPVAIPLQAVPLSTMLSGSGLLPVHLPLKPKLVVAPVARLPL